MTTGRRFSVPMAFKGDLLSRVALVVLLVLTVVALASPLLPGLDSRTTVGPRLASPSSEWWFGTDGLGRPMLPRVVEGIRTTMVISLLAILISTSLAVVIALFAATTGGVSDQVTVRIADAMFAFPAVLFSILVASIIGSGRSAAILAIVVITLPLMVRAIRAAALVVVERDFITTSRVGGASQTRIAFVHLLPNIAGTVVVQATYAASIAMLTEGALSFLGFGVQPPTASLGSLVQEGNLYLAVAPWVSLVPGATLAVAILAVNLVGDGLRDRLDPRAERALT